MNPETPADAALLERRINVDQKKTYLAVACYGKTPREGWWAKKVLDTDKTERANDDASSMDWPCLDCPLL
jgi:hypothetical protein